MGNKLKDGMEFENMIKLCDFLGWEYDYKHSNRIAKKLSKYVEFHRENRNKIIIDKVICEDEPIIQFKSRNLDYIYNMGDIVNVKSGEIEIIGHTKIPIKNSKSLRRGYMCKCLNDGYIYEDYEYNISKGVGCAVCNNKIVVPGINDMWTTNKELASLLLNPEDGYKFTKHSGQKVNWKCPYCNEIHYNRQISNISKRGLSCWCGRTRSYPNRFMYWLLTTMDIKFEDEMVFDWNRAKRYDFYIPDISCVIEMQGSQHYKEVSFTSTTLEYQIRNDDYKEKIAIENGIKNYFRIDCQQSDFNYIKNNVLSSALSMFFDFSNVDWDYVKYKCDKHILHEISEIWNSGNHDCKKIGEILGIDKGVVRKYANKCQEFKMIKIDNDEIERRRIENVTKSNYQSHSKPLICNENGFAFGNVSIATRKMSYFTGDNFSHTNILGTLAGKYSHHHGFTFSYISREEFNNIKNNEPDRAFGDLFIKTA